MKSISIFCLLIFLFVSCNEKNKEIVVNKRYEFLNDYITKLKPTAYFDTTETNQNYFFIKSLFSNDSEKMKTFGRNIFRRIIDVNTIYKIDTSIHRENILHSNADEIYRFYYWRFLCFGKVDITISKRNNSFQLELIVYTKLNTCVDSINKVKILSHQEIILSQTEWERFKDLLYKSDFWYLEENGRRGFDGDNLCVLGFDKSRSAYDRRFKIVNRHSSHTALWDVYQYLISISKTKIDMGCEN